MSQPPMQQQHPSQQQLQQQQLGILQQQQNPNLQRGQQPLLQQQQQQQQQQQPQQQQQQQQQQQGKLQLKSGQTRAQLTDVFAAFSAAVFLMVPIYTTYKSLLEMILLMPCVPTSHKGASPTSSHAPAVQTPMVPRGTSCKLFYPRSMPELFSSSS